MTRSDAEKLDWAFVAEQPEINYFRAEKMTPSGELINMRADTEDLVLAAIDSWENYPVQAPDSRSYEPPVAPVVEEPVVDETVA